MSGGAVNDPAAHPRSDRPRGPLGRIAWAAAWPARKAVAPVVGRLLAHIDERDRALREYLNDLRSEALAINHEATHTRGDIARRVQHLEKLLEADVAAAGETATVLGRTLADLLEHADATATAFAELAAEVRLARGASAGSLAAVEAPYVFRALGAVSPGGAILEASHPHALLAPSLRALGYAVTSVEALPPGLPREAFDAVVALEADLGGEDVPRLHAALRPGGLAILTSTALTEAATRALLAGWAIEDLRVARRAAGGSWSASEDGSGGGEPGVLLVTARRPA
jgi:hypothetical protein